MRERICRMICSTSTLSERTEKSDMSVFDRFAAIASARLAGTLSQEFRGLRDARAEDAQRAHQRLAAGELELGRVFADLRIPAGIRRHRFPVAEQAPPRAVEHGLHHALGV